MCCEQANDIYSVDVNYKFSDATFQLNFTRSFARLLVLPLSRTLSLALYALHCVVWLIRFALKMSLILCSLIFVTLRRKYTHAHYDANIAADYFRFMHVRLLLLFMVWYQFIEYMLSIWEQRHFSHFDSYAQCPTLARRLMVLFYQLLCIFNKFHLYSTSDEYKTNDLSFFFGKFKLR